MRSVHVSVRIKGRDKGKSVCTLACKLHINVDALLTETQTDIHEQKNVATQCNLLNAPPLELFPQASTSLAESFATETEPEEADLDTSFCSKQEDYTTE